MDRRSFLVLAGASLATTGCLGSSDGTVDDGGTGTRTPTPTPTETEEPLPSVAFAAASVQSGVVVTMSPDSIGVVDEGGQYFVVDADVTGGDAPEGTAFRLAVDDSEYGPMRGNERLYRDGTWEADYWQENGSGTLAFELPEMVSADDARITWPGGEWTLPESARDRLASPTPTFDVEFDAPASVEANESPTLTVTVTNVGEVSGRCVLALNRVGPRIAYTPVRDVVFDVGPDETVSREWAGKSPEAEHDVTYHLHAVDNDKTSRTIELAEGTG